MGVETALIIGAGIEVYGQMTAADAQAKANKANARSLREQKALQDFVNRREADIFKSDARLFIGEQMSAMARSGLDISGSLLMQIAGTKSQQEREFAAIKIGAQQRTNLIEQQAKQADDNAKMIKDMAPLQSLGTILNTYAKVNA